MFLKSSLILALLIASTISFADDSRISCIDTNLRTSKEINNRIIKLKIEMKVREELLQSRKELAEDAIKTSGKSKIAWGVGAIPLTLDGLMAPIFYQRMIAGIWQTSLGLGTISAGVLEYIASSAIGVVPAVYGNYQITYKGAKELLNPSLDSRSLIQLPDHAEEKLKNNESIEIFDHSISPICYLSYLRLELSNSEKSVFENELNGSLKNTIKDHLLAGTVAVKGTTKLYEITYLRQLIDNAEIKILKKM
jgi:hypothetical protein